MEILLLSLPILFGLMFYGGIELYKYGKKLDRFDKLDSTSQKNTKVSG